MHTEKGYIHCSLLDCKVERCLDTFLQIPALHDMSSSEEKGSVPKVDIQVSDDPNSCSYIFATTKALGSSSSEIFDGHPLAASSLGIPRPKTIKHGKQQISK